MSDLTADHIESLDEYQLRELAEDAREERKRPRIPGGLEDSEYPAETGEPYDPPDDAPIIPGSGWENFDIAIGFGAAAEDVAVEPEELPPAVDGGDLEIEQAIAQMLRLEDSAPDARITIRVEAGTVYLSGEVNRLQDIADIVETVEGLPHVREVEEDFIVADEAIAVKLITVDSDSREA